MPPSRRPASHAPPNEVRAAPIEPPLVALEGRLICNSVDQAALASELLAEHVPLSRAEPGNLRFDLWQQSDPLVWHLSELYADDAAFQAHRQRLRASRWGRESHGIQRDFIRSTPLPMIRSPQARDAAGIERLLGRNPSRTTSSAAAPAHGPAAHALLVEAAGVIIAFLMMTHQRTPAPALVVAALCVHAALRGRGLGTALLRAALQDVQGHTVLASGPRRWLERMGFSHTAPREHAGQAMMMNLPEHRHQIRPAPRPG